MSTFFAAVAVENGSSVVTLNEGVTTGNIEIGNVFVHPDNPTVPYFVAGLGEDDSPENPAVLYLNANYAGATNASAEGQFTRDFTPELGLPLVQPGDLYPHGVVADAMLRIDAAFADLRARVDVLEGS